MTGIPTSMKDTYIFCTPLNEFYFSCYQELLESYQIYCICCYESSIRHFEKISKYRGGSSFLDIGVGGDKFRNFPIRAKETLSQKF